jgi:hypothetical protein
LLVGILTAGAAGEDNHGVVFTFPTEGQVFNKMDTVNVTYTSPFSTPNLYLWCSLAEDIRNSTTPVHSLMIFGC